MFYSKTSGSCLPCVVVTALLSTQAIVGIRPKSCCRTFVLFRVIGGLISPWVCGNLALCLDLHALIFPTPYLMRPAGGNGRAMGMHYGSGSSATGAIHRRLAERPEALAAVEALAQQLTSQNMRNVKYRA